MPKTKVDFFNNDHYFVIKEFLDTSSGYAGTLTFDGYNSETARGWFKRDSKDFRIVTEGYMSHYEANRLLALTPEVCRLTAAIERYFEEEQSDFEGTRKDFLYFLTEAVREIMDDRERRKESKHPLPTTFPFVNIGTDSLIQTQLFRIIRDSSTKPEGNITNLQSLIRKLSDKRVVYAYQELKKKLKR